MSRSVKKNNASDGLTHTHTHKWSHVERFFFFSYHKWPVHPSCRDSPILPFKSQRCLLMTACYSKTRFCLFHAQIIWFVRQGSKVTLLYESAFRTRGTTNRPQNVFTLLRYKNRSEKATYSERQTAWRESGSIITARTFLVQIQAGGLSVWSLYVWVFCGHSGFLLQSRNLYVSVTLNHQLGEWMWLFI